MKRSVILAAVIIGYSGLVLGLSWAQAPMEFHGADSVYQREGVVILWAILKGPDEESSWVCLRLVNLKGPSNPFLIFSVEAVDPFSKEKEWITKGIRLENVNSVRSRRSFFKEKTGRRILFYGSAEEFQSEKPAMAVFYLGVPDTAPELLSEKDMETYFDQALERLKK